MHNPFFLLDDGRREAEYCTVLFLDIVGFTKMTEEDQLEAFKNLHDKLSKLSCINERNYQHENYVVIPSGDGVAVCFFGEFSKLGWKMPLLVAKELQKKIRSFSWTIRQGMNIGRAYRLQDIKAKQSNVIGNAINNAARAMDFGDGDHILCTEHYYESAFKNSKYYSRWFRRLPDVVDKHGGVHHLYNVCDENSFGNKEIPVKVKNQSEKTPIASKGIVYRKQLDLTITASARNSIAIPSNDFSLDCGSIFIECEVDASILNRKQSAYLFSHATNGGRPIVQGKGHPYSDVIAIGFNPNIHKWFFWIASTSGIDEYFDHSIQFSEGKHKLFANWNRDKKQTCFVVDGIEERRDDVTKAWPGVKNNSLIIGTWTWPLDIFYANSKIVEVVILNFSIDWNDYQNQYIKENTL